MFLTFNNICPNIIHGYKSYEKTDSGNDAIGFLILIVVHASHLVSSSFHPSSLSFSLPHLSKIDDFQNIYRECLIKKWKFVKNLNIHMNH